MGDDEKEWVELCIVEAAREPGVDGWELVASTAPWTALFNNADLANVLHAAADELRKLAEAHGPRDPKGGAVVRLVKPGE